MQLKGAQFRQFQEALLSAFPAYGDLERMVKFGLDENLSAIAAEETLSQVAFNLVKWAEAQGRLDDLLNAALEANPGSPELRALRGPEALPVPPSPDMTQLPTEQVMSLIVASLTLLAHFARNPTLVGPVAALQAHVEASQQQIEVLGDYKDLHDTLHKFQFECYNVMHRAMQRLPRDDPPPADQLIDHRTTLQMTTSRLRGLAQRPSLSDETQWIEELTQALAKLDEVSENPEWAPLDAACNLVQSVLEIYPAQINRSLFDAARDLRRPLTGLHRGMISIYQILPGMTLSADRIQQFGAGVAGLGELRDRLARLVDEHNQWQQIDVVLRLIETSLTRGLDELIARWSALRDDVERLCHSGQADWAQALRKYREELDGALAQPNRDANKIKRSFQTYRRWAAERFYNVDQELKHLCDQLRLMGEKLTSVADVLRELQHG